MNSDINIHSLVWGHKRLLRTIYACPMLTFTSLSFQNTIITYITHLIPLNLDPHLTSTHFTRTRLIMAFRIHLVALISLSFLLLSTAAAATKPGGRRFAKTTAHHPYKTEKLTHFRVYWHDTLSGAHPSSVPIIKPPQPKGNSSVPPSYFGRVNMMDNPLTEAPEVTSKLVGRSQGFYGVASQTELGFLMAMNFAFVEGKYNGSSITVLGRNMVLHKVREMPVAGGSGLFRFARGYVEARTHSLNLKTGDAVVEYHCYVLHF